MRSTNSLKTRFQDNNEWSGMLDGAQTDNASALLIKSVVRVTVKSVKEFKLSKGVIQQQQQHLLDDKHDICF